MKNLISELQAIENENKGFFKENNLKLSDYIIISKKPVMLWFNKDLQDKYKLPNGTFDKLNDLIISYYST